MDPTEARQHWNQRYAHRAAEDLSWFQKTPQQSIRWIRDGSTLSDPVIDVGAGASTLVDHLLASGYRDLSLLDLSSEALDRTRTRLGERGAEVLYLTANITSFRPTRKYKVWHDRAAFHFLVSEADRQAYKGALLEGLQPDGVFLLCTFALAGPERCSGLEVRRYDRASLEQLFAPELRLEEALLEEHHTPSGGTQLFHWARLRRPRPAGF